MPSEKPTTLALLSRQIRSCRECGLRAKCKGPIPGVGRMGARIMVVGMQPGWQEDKEELAWIGPAGQFFEAILEFIGIDPLDVYFTTAVKCYPGRTAYGRAGRSIKAPPSSIAACKPWIAEEVEVIKPQVIIAVGAEAMRFFGVKGGINKNGGQAYESWYEVPVIPVLHPDGLQKDPTKIPNFVTQLRSIVTFLNGYQEPPAFEKQWEGLDASLSGV